MKDERCKFIIFNSSLVLKDRKNPPYLIPIVKKTIFATESEGEILGSEGNRAYIEVCEFWKNW